MVKVARRLLRLIPLMALLCLSQATPVRSANLGSESPIVTLGGDSHRNHMYSTVLPAALCVLRAVPVGRTLSQPLVVRYPQAAGVAGPHRDVVFHLGQTDLKLLSLDGEVLASHRVQTATPNSLQQMTYWMASPSQPNPDQDVLYVGLRPPGLKAFSVKSLLQQTRGASPIATVTFESAKQLVAAPLPVGFSSSGQDLTFVPLVEDQIALVQNLATAQSPEDGRFHIVSAPGWNSATPTALSKGYVAITAGGGLSILRTVEYL